MKKKSKIKNKIFTIFLIAIILINSSGLQVLATSIASKSEIKSISIGEIGGHLAANNKMVANLYVERNFTTKIGEII